MESEAKIILAFLFNRSGKTALKDAELYLPLSMELKWFSTKESQLFVTYAIKQKLLLKKEGLLHANFPVEKITIPVGFTPTKKLFSEQTSLQKEENILSSIITSISEQTNRSSEDIEQEIHRLEQEKNINPEIAALYVARKYHIDTTSWHDSVEKTLFKENTGQ
jgi:hypothetical protein